MSPTEECWPGKQNTSEGTRRQGEGSNTSKGTRRGETRRGEGRGREGEGGRRLLIHGLSLPLFFSCNPACVDVALA